MRGEPLYKSRPVGPYPAVRGARRVNDFIALSEGLSNCYLIETDEGCVQLNSGMWFEAPVHRINFNECSRQPVRYLALTQGHVDHVGGVAYFREHHPGLQVIAQAGNPAHQRGDQRLAQFRAQRSAFAFADMMIETIAEMERQYGPLPAQDVPVPDILFDERYELDLGGLRVELIALPGCETNDSLVVWLPQHRICFTGNLFGCPFGHFPNLVTIRGDAYRDAEVCRRAVDAVRELGAQTICYGHHQPIEGTELIDRELGVLSEAIGYVFEETVKGMNAGKDVRALMRDIRLPPHLEVGELYGKVSWSVRAIWESLAGWFHHESTTELYAVHPAAVRGDLVELAGGEQALVARARERMERGEHVEALHLLEVALSNPAAGEQAVRAAIDAHRALAGETQNFWLVAWLKESVKKLEARLA